MRAICVAAAFCSVASIFLPSPGGADTPTVPTDTTAFLSYCDSNLEACRLAVVDVNNIMMMRQMGGNHGCTLPNPTTTDLAKRKEERRVWTVAILDWLKVSGNVRAQNADDAIEQAMKALWPQECK
jgi:hypothetical protein